MAIGEISSALAIKLITSTILWSAKTSLDQAKQSYKNRDQTRRLRKAAELLISITQVRTLRTPDKITKIGSFYYPLKVNDGEGVRKINSLEDFGSPKALVIQGTVGQGKSTFCRYLVSREIVEAKRMPVFVECRHFVRGQGIVSFLKHQLSSLGVDLDDRSFEILLSDSRVSIFIDGFDELDGESRPQVIQELIELTIRYPNLHLIISSRPDSGIEYLPTVKVFRLQPLEQGDFHPFVHRLTDDLTLTDRLDNALKKSWSRIGELLTTPLTATLLVKLFETQGRVPDTIREFYEQLFVTLLLTHDRISKPGYQRKRKSGLVDSEMREAFEAMCACARKHQRVYFTPQEAVGLAKAAVEACNLKCSADALLADIVEITCLMGKDGPGYSFIHKSVLEFYCASFIRHRPDMKAVGVYNQLASNIVMAREWGVELNFLWEIDRYRFSKHFIESLLIIFHRLELKSLDNALMSRFMEVSLAEIGAMRFRPSPDGRTGSLSREQMPTDPGQDWLLRKGEFFAFFSRVDGNPLWDLMEELRKQIGIVKDLQLISENGVVVSDVMKVSGDLRSLVTAFALSSAEHVFRFVELARESVDREEQSMMSSVDLLG